jgi:hypothetical protein
MTDKEFRDLIAKDADYRYEFISNANKLANRMLEDEEIFVKVITSLSKIRFNDPSALTNCNLKEISKEVANFSCELLKLEYEGVIKIII